MSRRTFKLRIWPASGGVDQSSIPGTIRADRLDDCDNIIFTVNGSRKKRWGLNTYYRSGFTPTISSNMRGMFDYWRNVSSVQTQKMIVFAGGKLWTDSHDGRFTDVSGTTTLYLEDQVTFDVFTGFMIACFENAVPQRWTMTGVFQDLGGTAPNGSLVRVHRGKAWIAGVKAYPHRLYYSSTDDPEDWIGASAGSIEVDTGDADPIGITAIFPSFYNTLYVAKRRSLYKVVEAYSDDLANTIYQLDPVVKGLGCISHNSVAATPGDIIWASEKGIHSLAATDKYGDVATAYLSYPIHEYYARNVSLAKAKNMWGVYSNDMNSYLLAYTSIGKKTNYDVIGYNVILGEFFFWHDLDSAALCQLVDSKGKTRLALGRESLNIGYFNDSLVDDFTSELYDSYFITPIIFPMQNPDVVCNFKNLFVFLKPQQYNGLTVTYQIDGKASKTETIDMTGAVYSTIGTAVIGTDIIGGGGMLKKLRVPLSGEGSSIQLAFQLTSDVLDTDLDVYGYVIEGEYADDSALPSVST